MGQKQQNPPAAAPTFESAMGRLEQIVEEMEGDKLPLEQLLERYEEGASLVKVCQEKLEAAERRVELITRNASGKPQAVPLDPDTATAASAPASTAPAAPTPAAPTPAAPTPAARRAAESDDPADVSLF